MELNICVFIGSHRPSGRRDSGEDLVRALISKGLNVTAVYTSPNDPLMHKGFKHCTVLPLPGLLRQSQKSVIKSLSDKSQWETWQAWLGDFSARRFSLGLVYFGSWIPPELFRIPELGFINFHPGPLPALRGFEAETWAILTDMKYFYGTVHRVSHNYDEGEIIWRSPRVKIRSRETPESLLRRTCYAGIERIEELVRTIHADEISVQKQDMMDGMNASVKLMRSKAEVDWNTDSLAVLDRKNRAFNGQLISVSLFLMHGGQRRIIRDIKPIPGRFGWGLGKLVGYYPRRGPFYHQPMYQALDGQVVLALYPAGECKPNRASVFAGYDDGY